LRGFRTGETIISYQGRLTEARKGGTGVRRVLKAGSQEPAFSFLCLSGEKKRPPITRRPSWRSIAGARACAGNHSRFAHCALGAGCRLIDRDRSKRGDKRWIAERPALGWQ